MASRYHPLFGGLWSSVHLEGLPFEAKGFFAYLCSNDRLRPSGIYRVTDAQLAVDTGLPIGRIRSYLQALVERDRIVRDGAWIFVQGYLKRQPRGDRLLKGAEADVMECTSEAILKAFGHKYPHLDRWSTDRLLTLTRPSAANGATEQSSTEQSSTEHTCRSRDGQEMVTRPSRVALRATAVRLLEFLNHKAGKHFQAETNVDFIVARLRDGASEDQCRAIIGRKAREWRADARMAKYVRPSTLFNREKFAQYLGELPASAFEGKADA